MYLPIYLSIYPSTYAGKHIMHENNITDRLSVHCQCMTSVTVFIEHY